MRSIVNLVIVMALATQVSHAAWIFNDIGKPNDWTLPALGWVFALSLEASIFIFTIYSRKGVATFFAVVSTLVNLLYYWIEVSLSYRFFSMLVISPIIPTTIWYYSDLIAVLRAREEEEAAPIGGYYPIPDPVPAPPVRVPDPEPAPVVQESRVSEVLPNDGYLSRPRKVAPKKTGAARTAAPASSQAATSSPAAASSPAPASSQATASQPVADDWVIVEEEPAPAPLPTDWRDRSPNTRN